MPQTGSVEIFYGDGRWLPVAAGIGPIAAWAADVDGDNRLDLVVLDGTGQRVKTFLEIETAPVDRDCDASATLDGCEIASGVLRDADANSVPDACEPARARFRRADTNDDGATDLADAVHVLNYLFSAGPSPGCLDAADANDDGRADLSDPVYLLGFLFLGSPPPAAPFGECGEDPTPDALECTVSSCQQ